MANTASSAMPLPVKDSAAQTIPNGEPVLTFAPSTRFSPPPIARRRTASSHDSDEQDTDPDDLVASQTDLAREQLKRDVVGPGLVKEKEVKCGFLAKRTGGAGKTWNKRWCVLRLQSLSIYKNNSEYKLKRIIRVDEIVSVKPIEKRNRPFAFMVTTNDRSFYFDASSSQELDSWLEAVQRAIDIVNGQDGRESDETVRRQFATASRALSPQATTAQATAGDFFSLPAAGNQRRSSGMARAVHTIFEGSADDRNIYSEPSTSPDLIPVAAIKSTSIPSDAHQGLCIDTNPHVLKQQGTGQLASEETDTVTAFPPGINPESEAAPVLDDEEEDDEPNFNTDHRREIEDKLADDQVILSGYLLKQDKLKQWRKRWFVLRRNTLSYYHSSKEYELKQIMRREDVHSVREPDPCTAKAKSLHRGYFKIVTTKRSYWIAHDNNAMAGAWFKALEQWKAGAIDMSSQAVKLAKKLASLDPAEGAPGRPHGPSGARQRRRSSAANF